MPEADSIPRSLVQLLAALGELRTTFADPQWRSPERLAALEAEFRVILDATPDQDGGGPLSGPGVTGNALLLAVADLRADLNHVVTVLHIARARARRDAA